MLRRVWSAAMLSAVDIRGVAVGAPALQVLCKAPWRQRLRFLLTVNLQDSVVFKQLVAICRDQQWVRRLHSIKVSQGCDLHLNVVVCLQRLETAANHCKIACIGLEI